MWLERVLITKLQRDSTAKDRSVEVKQRKRKLTLRTSDEIQSRMHKFVGLVFMYGYSISSMMRMFVVHIHTLEGFM